MEQQAQPDPAHSERLHQAMHKLSNRLTAVLMNAGLLSLALRGNDRLRRYADDIHESATRSAELLRLVRSMVEERETDAHAGQVLTHERDAEHNR